MTRRDQMMKLALGTPAAEQQEESNLTRHAKRELRLAGMNKRDSDYGGMLGPAVLRLIKQHSSEGHSGGSHHSVLSLFNRLADFKALTPLTDNPSEWRDTSKETGRPHWQNIRQSSCFSEDGGKTYWNLDESKRTHKGRHGVTFATYDKKKVYHKSVPHKPAEKTAALPKPCVTCAVPMEPCEDCDTGQACKQHGCDTCGPQEKTASLRAGLLELAWRSRR